MDQKSRLLRLAAWFRCVVLKRPRNVVHVEFALNIDSERDEADTLEIEMIIDGERLEAFDFGPIDLSELQKAIKCDGVYYIWTCWCGAPGCGGNVNGVSVVHENDHSVWHDMDLKLKYRFDRVQLARALENVTYEARRLITERPKLMWAPETNGRAM